MLCLTKIRKNNIFYAHWSIVVRAPKAKHGYIAARFSLLQHMCVISYFFKSIKTKYVSDGSPIGIYDSNSESVAAAKGIVHIRLYTSLIHPDNKFSVFTKKNSITILL